MSIETTDVKVAFGGVQALDGVSMSVPQGEVTALIGPNGSGKTTLVNCISGYVQPQSGDVVIDGTGAHGMGAEERVDLGIGRTFQTPRIEPGRTIAESILVGVYPTTKSGLLSTVFRTPRFRRNEQEARERAKTVIDDFGLRDVQDERVESAPVWMLRVLEVARAVAMAPSYILLDEPAAGVDEEARAKLGQLIRRLADSGLGVLLIEHNFGLIREVSDSVVVLNRGTVLFRGSSAAAETDADVIDVYLGGVSHG